MYATFQQYKDIYLMGRPALIPETEFDYWITQAGFHIDIVTFNRLRGAINYNKFWIPFEQDVPVTLKDLIIKTACGVAEILYKDENKKPRSSWSIGSFSESFADEVAPEVQDAATLLIRRNLTMTGLTGRGV